MRDWLSRRSNLAVSGIGTQYLVWADHSSGAYARIDLARLEKTGFVINSADESAEQTRGCSLGRDKAERKRRERQLTELAGSHDFPRDSQRGDLVVFSRWSDSCHRAGRNFSSRRLAKGARTRQADPLRAAFLRGATRGIRHRTFHLDEGHRIDRAGLDSMALLLGVPCRCLLYRSRA